MAEKMTRRSFMKCAAAVAAAVSLSGALAGCGGGGNETNLGGFSAWAGKWDAKSYKPGISEADDKWYADFKVVVGARNLDSEEIHLPGELIIHLEIDGQPIELESGGLLTSKTLVLKKNETKTDWVNFRMVHGQEELYSAMEAGKANIQLTLGLKTTETYTANYDTMTFEKTAAE